MNTTGVRLKILGDDEIAALYGRPHFTDDERLEYFVLAPTEKAALAQLHSIKSRLYCILQLGSCKSHHMVFVGDLPDVVEDARFIQGQYFPDFHLDDLDRTKVTRLRQHGLILELFRYRTCDAGQRQALAHTAPQAARLSAKPVFVFRELRHSLQDQRLVAPGYSLMPDTVSQALTHEQDRLAAVISHRLDRSHREALARLLEDAPGLYELTQLRREPKDCSASEITREIRRGEQRRDLYHLAKSLLPDLGISHESGTYYASFVGDYSVSKLKRFEEATAHVYLLCFVSHRSQRLHDTLLSSLIHHVRRYPEAAKTVAKERVSASRSEGNEALDRAGQVLRLFTDDGLPQQTPFHEVRAKACSILERDKIDFVADHLTTKVKCDATAFQWEHMDELAHQCQRHLRPLLLAVDWTASAGHTALIEAVAFLKDAFQQGRSLSQYPPSAYPLSFIPHTAKRALSAQGVHNQRHVLPDRYECLVYRLLRNGFEAGDVFCRESVRFRSFEDDLSDDDRWQDKANLIANTDLPLLKQPIREHLAALETQLEDRLIQVNQRIASGENVHFAIKKRGSQTRWTLQYPQSAALINHPCFEALQQVDLSSVLPCVHRHCRFMEAFDHVLGRYVTQEVDDLTLTACLMAWGTNMGLGRMGAVSAIGSQALTTTSENFLRLETLRAANDLVSNAIAELPLFGQYAIGESSHSSSDGQKCATRIPTINARHSPKYFGLKKGIVSYTLVANHVPIHAESIGANDHESHYGFAILFQNTTDIQPEIHSTDTHGTNEVNVALLNMFGYQCAPRYRDIYDKVGAALYGFKHPSQSDEAMVLKPIRKLSPELIIEEWENMQRILMSVAFKTTTQSTIVRKLSAFARKNKTRRALWEYDTIFRSLYLLDYLDSPPLRRHVQPALNRGESSHQLRRAVSHANFGKLRFKTEHEQHIWGECARLMTHCILYSNAMLFSSLLDYQEAAGDVQEAALLKHISPVAWQHINLSGRYEFRNGPEAININEIVRELAQLPVRQVMTG